MEVRAHAEDIRRVPNGRGGEESFPPEGHGKLFSGASTSCKTGRKEMIESTPPSWRVPVCALPSRLGTLLVLCPHHNPLPSFGLTFPAGRPHFLCRGRRLKAPSPPAVSGDTIGRGRSPRSGTCTRSRTGGRTAIDPCPCCVVP